MADGVFNIAKGRVAQLARNVDGSSPANSRLVVVALQFNASFPADGVLADFDDLAAILADANITEAAFTNYARQELAAADVTVTVDDSGDEQTIDIPNIVYTDAGGAANNTLQKIILCYDPDNAAGTDSDIIPLTHHDTNIVTDGSTVTYTIPANGFFGAT